MSREGLWSLRDSPAPPTRAFPLWPQPESYANLKVSLGPEACA